MALKRTYQVGSRKDLLSRNVKPRLERVERIIRQSFELKYITVDAWTPTIASGALGYVNICAIAQGSNVNSRIGNEITVVRVEIRGSMSSITDPLSNCLHLVSPDANSDPTISDFQAVPGGHLKQAQYGRELAWRFFSDNGNVRPAYVNWKPRGGWKILYSGTGTGDAIRNKLFVAVPNFNSVSLTPGLSVKVWFRDG